MREHFDFKQMLLLWWKHWKAEKHVQDAQGNGLEGQIARIQMRGDFFFPVVVEMYDFTS